MLNQTLYDLAKSQFKYTLSLKAKEYVNEFYDKTQTATMIKAKVMGNHGEYTVSLRIRSNNLTVSCNCYHSLLAKP